MSRTYRMGGGDKRQACNTFLSFLHSRLALRGTLECEGILFTFNYTVAPRCSTGQDLCNALAGGRYRLIPSLDVQPVDSRQDNPL